MTIKIIKKKTGNCGCAFCGATQAGLALHPYTVWIKEDEKKRGENFPVCSEYCANGFIESLKRKNLALQEENKKLREQLEMAYAEYYSKC